MITPGEWVKSRRSNPSGCCVEVALVRKGEEAEAVWTVLLAPGTVKDVHNERPAPRAAGKDSGWLIGVRDSHDRDGPVLWFTPQEWEAFCGGVRDGEFDMGETIAGLS